MAGREEEIRYHIRKLEDLLAAVPYQDRGKYWLYRAQLALLSEELTMADES